MNQRGKIQFTTILLILGLVTAGWAAFIWGPIYIDNMTVRQTTTQYMSRFTSHSTRGDIDLRQLYVNELNRIGDHVENDEFGNPKKVPGLGITPENITMEYDSVQSIARVGVEYDRTFQLYPFKKWKTIHFSVFKEQPFQK